ncbi:hypothetical protein RchiOBHm_Chr5g0030641 [Rosa chinensis]|uniref:Uncharacterized protein n=1 Tax=Rosa chinensis TaxID=74649 RepID=A0A2P6Q9X5_ROSCH|nr:hypothetical protein RchiOBHm_Chr5g0030641 [Rosa chinensis]
MPSVLASLGAKAQVFDNEIMVNIDGITSVEPISDEIRKIRGGFFVLDDAVVASPGGCDIGLPDRWTFTFGVFKLLVLLFNSQLLEAGVNH